MDRLTFRPKHRLTHAKEFAAVYEGKCRKNRGPLMIFTLPNDLGHPRLGLSVGTRVGNAVVRSRTKRLIREAFRLSQHELLASGQGRGYDVVVSVRSPPPTAGVAVLPGLMKSLVELVAEGDAEWRRRSRREQERAIPPEARLSEPGT